MASFGLAQAAGMTNLPTLPRDNLRLCRMRKTENPLWGTRTENVFPEPMCNATNPQGFQGFHVTKQERQIKDEPKLKKPTDSGPEWPTT